MKMELIVPNKSGMLEIFLKKENGEILPLKLLSEVKTPNDTVVFLDIDEKELKKFFQINNQISFLE